MLEEEEKRKEGRLLTERIREHIFWQRRHLTRAINIYIRFQSKVKSIAGRGKSTQSRNSKYKIASKELVMDSRRKKDWKIRLEK